MRIERTPDGRRLVLAAESMAEAQTLGRVPAWQDQAKTWSDRNLPLLVIDPATMAASLGAWTGGNGMTPLVLLAPPLSGISRAVGLQVIFDAYGYAPFNRPFGHDDVFSNPAYIAGHNLTATGQLDAHVAAFAGAVGIAVLNQPAGAIWDLHAPIPAAAALANPNVRVVHLVRDPRDMAVSAYFFFKRQAESRPRTPLSESASATLQGDDFAAERKDAAFLKLITEGFAAVSRSGFSRFESPRQYLDRVIAALDHPRVFTLRYERQHSDPVAQYAELIDWLSAANSGRGLSNRDALIAEAVRRGTFAAQTGGKMKEGGQDEAPRDVSPTGHVRKGIVGDWRNHFTPELRRAFNDSVGDRLMAAGFETDADWWRA